MGLALVLLPVDGWSETNGKVWGFSHTVLPLRRHSEFDDDAGDADPYEDIQKFEVALPKDHDISSYLAVDNRTKDHAYGVLKKTPYGKPYTFVTAGQLAPILQKHQPGWPNTAYVSALPPETRIILHWH